MTKQHRIVDGFERAMSFSMLSKLDVALNDVFFDCETFIPVTHNELLTIFATIIQQATISVRTK